MANSKNSNSRNSKKSMSVQDKEDWKSLYDYVRYNILGYDENQSLSRNMVLRLKGLCSNKFMENKSISTTANYSYKVVLNTFKYCIVDIKRGLKANHFNDENHKFNYILRIVESKLNTVYICMKNAEKTQKEIEQSDISRVNDYVNNFRPRPEKKRKKNYDDMW